MDNHYSIQAQKEIEDLLLRLQEWKDSFSFNVKYHIDGWAIRMRQKITHPRYIEIFKGYSEDNYLIKSFTETYEDLHVVENIKNKDDLLFELRERIQV